MTSLTPPLQQGGRVDRLFEDEQASMYSVSFSNTYVLGVWLTPQTNEFAMRRAVREALPAIESLTLSLPPPDGSGNNSGAQHA